MNFKEIKISRWTFGKREIIVAFVLFFLLILIALVFSLKGSHPARLNDQIASLPTSKPDMSFMTPSLTPTPTLSPQQILEIQKKNFEYMSKNFGPCKSVPILMYHHVMDAAAAKKIGSSKLNVPPDVFREQMDYLLLKGYSVVGLDQVIDRIRTNSLPVKPVVLTFDDGYNDFYNTVFPILKEKNIKATIFVISQYVGGGRYLNWNQVKEMSDFGLVLIGDHTLNHSNLPKATFDEEKNQIVSAKIIIENHIGKSVLFFAYPYGGTTQNAKNILAENGFSAAVTTVHGRTQCLGLPYDWQRVRIGASPLSKYGF